MADIRVETISGVKAPTRLDQLADLRGQGSKFALTDLNIDKFLFEESRNVGEVYY
ncbi:hypothetical protein [Arthrobacter sp. Br18]|uniref:hypothetical protein n=1 Tax=Arthrobacter sp. Br18 TaxID=1312954 RepID=UPI0004B87F8F|nr:hypothetical protein [Arthrobacter sp. Br18]